LWKSGIVKPLLQSAHLLRHGPQDELVERNALTAGYGLSGSGTASEGGVISMAASKSKRCSR
jgi:hypothetical protein